MQEKGNRRRRTYLVEVSIQQGPLYEVTQLHCTKDRERSSKIKWINQRVAWKIVAKTCSTTETRHYHRRWRLSENHRSNSPIRDLTGIPREQTTTQDTQLQATNWRRTRTGPVYPRWGDPHRHRGTGNDHREHKTRPQEAKHTEPDGCTTNDRSDWKYHDIKQSLPKKRL